ncbi:MAG: hypothetical protein PHF24_10285, partial [Syntrophomonas sp.]|nr:hypothetical protein [Syntrophomonas sp.]
LEKIDINISDLSTARGVKVNDGFTNITQKYGENYTRAYDKSKPHFFDALYGTTQHYIVFRIEDNVVKRIIIGHSVN